MKLRDAGYIPLTDADCEALAKAGRSTAICGEGFERHLGCTRDGTCVHLAEDGLCAIYDARPALCRAYPWALDLTLGCSVDTNCPAVRPSVNPHITMDALEALHDLYWHYLSEAAPEGTPSTRE